jgi:hypoxanthine phosphoribosyltransferase
VTTDPGFTEAVTTAELAERVAEIGAAITNDYAGRCPVMVAVLTGSLPFLADLVRAIAIPVEVDFLALSRFGEGGRIRIAMDTSEPLSGRDVILVEDIVDTGLSLAVLRRMIADRGAATVSAAALLDKVPRRLVEVPLEYRGFEVGDEYLIGYGLDLEGRYRNLRSLWAVLDHVAFRSDPARMAHLLYTGR